MSVTFVAIPSIAVPEGRQRRNFDAAALFDLTEDIRATGLLTPIILSDRALLAGERRLRAVSELCELGVPITFLGEAVPLGTIPALQFNEITALERMQVEYSENEYREPLTWQERAKALAALTELRRAQASSSGTEAPDLYDITREVLGKIDVTADQVAGIRTSVNVAKYLDDPEVAKATTAKEAAKIIKRREQTATNRLAAQAFKEASAKAPDLTRVHRIIHGGALNSLLDVEPGSVDLIVSDPPYGISAHNFGDGATNVKGQHQYDDSFENWVPLMQSFAQLAFRVTKPTSAMYLFCDFDRFRFLKEFCENAGWYVHRTPLIWSKGKNGLVPIPGKSHARSYELILFATRDMYESRTTRPDVILCPPDENLGHGAQKPVALYTELIQRSAGAGSLVLDPFAGSGPLVPAAHASSCRSITIELDEAHYGIICNRLKELTDEPALL